MLLQITIIPNSENPNNNFVIVTMDSEEVKINIPKELSFRVFDRVGKVGFAEFIKQTKEVRANSKNSYYFKGYK